MHINAAREAWHCLLDASEVLGGQRRLLEYVGPISHNETEGLSGRGLQKSVPSECDRQLGGQDQLSSSWLSDIHQLVFVDIPELCSFLGKLRPTKLPR